ncbi:uncharacterized protein [Periplaneta americana]|uniref:uncharacterized protein n=1 Tax=Periplaneta americana TaxID=6978 RepID=UPI0037E88EAF
MRRSSLVAGKYPTALIQDPENDLPPRDQIYCVLEYSFAGQELKDYPLISATQSLSIFMQTAFALAAGEAALQFEHRDLHIGNLLLFPTDEDMIKFQINGEEYCVLTIGIKTAFALAVGEAALQFEHWDLHLGSILMQNSDEDDVEFCINGEDYCVPTNGIETAFALAVGEVALQFEHRDLHIGNLLFSPMDEDIIKFRINCEEYCVTTKGIKTAFALAVGEAALQFEHRDLHLGSILMQNSMRMMLNSA